MDDPIVDEVRRAGDAYFRKFNYDLAAAFEDLRRRTEEARKAGQKVVNLRPRPVQPHAPRTKKVG